MIRRKPLGSTVSIGWTVDAGTANGARAFLAQPGSGTGLVCLGAKDSPPERGLCDATASPDSRGVITATIALSLVKYFFATRFTSAAVTLLIASMSSSGDRRPSTASACDHSAAKPAIEFLRNCASATSCLLVASTNSAGMPLAA